MKPEINRDADSVANAIAADLQTFETESGYLTHCRTATNRRSQAPAYSQRLDAEDEGAIGPAKTQAMLGLWRWHPDLGRSLVLSSKNLCRQE